MSIEQTEQEVQVKHAQFKYHVVGVATNPETGEQIERLYPRIARRDEVVTLTVQSDIDRGEALGAFYTDADYEDDSDETSDDDGDAGDVPDVSDHDALVAWIRDSRPTAVQVVEAAGTDPDRAQALLDAENEASGGDPRKSVKEPLEKIING